MTGFLPSTELASAVVLGKELLLAVVHGSHRKTRYTLPRKAVREFRNMFQAGNY
jgi:hypothetical protein